MDDVSYLRELINATGAVLKEGNPFNGSILHLEGLELVVDVSFGSLGSPQVLVAGSRHTASDMLVGQLFRGGRTHSWADVRDDPRLAGTRGAREHRVRAFVGTLFQVGARTYALSMVPSSRRWPRCARLGFSSARSSTVWSIKRSTTR
jgi:hypothetical protein